MRLDIIISSVVLIILIITAIVSMDYPPRARLFPLILIIITCGLVGLHLIKLVWGKTKQEAALEEKRIATKVTFIRHLRTPAWLGGFLLSIYLLGFTVGTSLFSLLYLKLNGLKWITTILFAIGVVAFVYGCFQLALKIPLYEGILFG